MEVVTTNQCKLWDLCVPYFKQTHLVFWLELSIKDVNRQAGALQSMAMENPFDMGVPWFSRAKV